MFLCLRFQILSVSVWSYLFFPESLVVIKNKQIQGQGVPITASLVRGLIRNASQLGSSWGSGWGTPGLGCSGRVHPADLSSDLGLLLQLDVTLSN